MIICPRSRRWLVEPNQPKNHNRLLSVSVPGKALLFGEYGVMRGGEAVVVPLPAYRMGLSISFSAPEEKPVHHFVSRFLPERLALDQSELEGLLLSESESELRNFACYLSGFREYLSKSAVAAEVNASFAPSLGFGTSSALLACFHIALSEFVYAKKGSAQLEIKNYWQRLYDSLLRLQGHGSGYDVAVQAWFALCCSDQRSTSLLRFKNLSHGQALSFNGFEPEIARISVESNDLRQFGCFVETGVRSDTRAVLRSAMRKVLPEEFFAAQSDFARQFLQNPTSAQARRLCREASALARRSELLPQRTEIEIFVSECERLDIPWKTMGAGHGDCLWVMASRSAIESIIRKISAQSLKVRHAFEDEQ